MDELLEEFAEYIGQLLAELWIREQEQRRISGKRAKRRRPANEDALPKNKRKDGSEG